MTTGALHDAGVNRSRGSFDRDTPEERAHFPEGIDPRSQSLQITRGGQLVGVLNWFATHATSMTSHSSSPPRTTRATPRGTGNARSPVRTTSQATPPD